MGNSSQPCCAGQQIIRITYLRTQCIASIPELPIENIRYKLPLGFGHIFILFLVEFSKESMCLDGFL